MERCGKINASNSGSDSWTGIGVVAGFCTVVLIRQWLHRRNGEVTWRSELLQRLQEVRGNCKTRNQLYTSQVAESHIDTLINARHKRTKKMQWTREGAHHVLQIRAMMASEEWESKYQGAVLSALGAVA